MSEVIFEGKKYKDIDADAQSVLHTTNVHTFRYFPLDKVWMASDVTAEYFGLEKFYKIEKESDGPEFICEEDKALDRSLYTQIIGGKDIVSAEVRSHGGNNYYKITLSALEKDEQGRVTVIAGIIEDYDDRMRKSMFEQVLAGDYDSVYSVDFEKNQVVAYKIKEVIEDRYGEQISGLPPYEDIMHAYIEGEVVEDERIEMHSVTSYESINAQLKKNRVFMHDYRVVRDGKTRFIRYKIVKLNQDEELKKAVIGFADITKDKLEKWERLAFLDSVTLGNNYNYYAERLKSEDRTGFIISLDIKDFKVINNVCGIAMGDKILQETSKFLDRLLEDDGYYGHVNGDHFVLFIPSDEEEDVIVVVNKITDEFRVLVKNNDIPKISPYFGITKWKPGSRTQLIFSQANFAKHRIKDEKGINYGFYSDDDNAKAIETKKIEDSFDDAIAKEQFEVWYQPKYSPGDKELTGAEALVRWRLPNGDLVPPGKFIPIYEKNGMIKQLDNYVFTRVCMQQKKWIEELGRTIPISINLSRASLSYENIVEDYRKIADNIGVLPELVPIEITETAAIKNGDIKELADRFYSAGFPLHIDDFGTGYSSLSTLNLMKFDTLKLDKSLIDYIGEFGGDRLIKHTVALAKDMGLRVTAEGVEKSEQVNFLKEVECDNIQGFLYSKPVTTPEFEQKLKEENLSSLYTYRKGQSYTYYKR